MLTGAELIAKERDRQIVQEGWTSEHDDTHLINELVFAAIAYATEAIERQRDVTSSHHLEADPPDCWPWSAGWWKPGDDPVRMLVKAGALIAAEIDSLQRADDRDGR